MSDGDQTKITARGAGGGLALLVAVAAVALWALLLQRTFYREDGLQLVYNFLLKGNRAHDIHPLYLPLAGGFADLLAFTGLGLFTRATLFSLVCTAGGLLLVAWQARRAALGRQGALFVAAVACCPAVGFFATVVEFHALFFCLACLCFAVAEGLARPEVGEATGRRPGQAVLLAACTALATHAHASGHLLVPLFFCWIAGRRGLRASIADLSVLVAAHAGIFLISRPLLLGALGLDVRTSNTAWAWVQQWLRPRGLVERVGHVALYEVLLPYAFLWLVALVPLARRTPRAVVVLAWLGFLPYFALAVSVLADPRSGAPIREWGSYLLPLAVPGAFLLVRALGARAPLLAGVLAASLAVQIGTIRSHDVRPGQEWGAALRAELDARPTLLLCGTEELPWVLVEAPEVRPYHAIEALTRPGGADWLVAKLAEVLVGERVLLTRRAQDELSHPAVGAAGKALLAKLRGDFEPRPMARGVFSADELRRR